MWKFLWAPTLMRCFCETKKVADRTTAVSFRNLGRLPDGLAATRLRKDEMTDEIELRIVRALAEQGSEAFNTPSGSALTLMGKFLDGK